MTDIFASPETREGAVVLLALCSLGILEPRLPWVIVGVIVLVSLLPK